MALTDFLQPRKLALGALAASALAFSSCTPIGRVLRDYSPSLGGQVLGTALYEAGKHEDNKVVAREGRSNVNVYNNSSRDDSSGLVVKSYRWDDRNLNNLADQGEVVPSSFIPSSSNPLFFVSGINTSLPVDVVFYDSGNNLLSHSNHPYELSSGYFNAGGMCFSASPNINPSNPDAVDKFWSLKKDIPGEYRLVVRQGSGIPSSVKFTVLPREGIVVSKKDND